MFGASTSYSSMSLCPPFFIYRPLEHFLLIPMTLQYHASDLHQWFVFQLPPPKDEVAFYKEQSSAGELLSRFLVFVTQATEEGNHIQGTYEDVIWFVLTKLESLFQQGNLTVPW